MFRSWIQLTISIGYSVLRFVCQSFLFCLGLIVWVVFLFYTILDRIIPDFGKDDVDNQEK